MRPALVLVAVLASGAAAVAFSLARPASDAREASDRRGAVPILLYHRVEAKARAAYPELYVHPADFAAQMRWLADHGYQAVTLERVHHYWRGDGSLPERPVVISFDDGYKSVFTDAFPILRRLRWPGMLCLTVGHVPSNLTADMVVQLRRAGWEIDAHTLTHPDLTRLNPRRLEREVQGSRAVLRRRFGVRADFFCYPYGRHSAPVVAAVRRAGYLGAAATQYGLAVPSDRFRLKRIGIERADGLTGFVYKLEGAYAEMKMRLSD